MKGLFTKYIIQKRVPCDCGADGYCKKCGGKGFLTEEVDPKGKYFVLRIDEDDPHGEASRLAISAYASAIQNHNLNLAADLWDLMSTNCPELQRPIFYRNAGEAARKDYERQLSHWIKVNSLGNERKSHE